MKQIVNKEYKELFTSNSRYIVLMGGRGAGRSTVASQFANANLIGDKYFRCAIMRYILGDIRNSIYREILDRAEENETKEALDINDSNMTITYGKNTINAVGFRKSSGDQKSKLKSLANYNCVIIEEADEILEEDFMQLDDSLRTVKSDIKIILLLNPPAKSHWIIKRWFNLIPSDYPNFFIPELKKEVTDTTFIRTSYLDNIKNISEQSIKNYKEYEKTKPDHYCNMILGLVPETVRGKIYTNWNVIEELPHEARLERYGLDFGFTNDPTAIVGVYRHNGGFIVDEVSYTKGLLNNQIAAILNMQPKSIVIADSAEPKSIEDLKQFDLMVMPAVKGADSIKRGIDKVKQLRISITARSKNIITEYENYAWLEDKEGKGLNVPKPGYDHAMDALRYAFESLVPDEEPEPEDTFVEERPLYPGIGI